MVDMSDFKSGAGITPELHDQYKMEFIRRALKDPRKPAACGGVLHFALNLLVENKNVKYTDEFLRATYQFMTTERTPRQFTDMLLGPLTQCACGDDSFGLHMAYQITKLKNRPTGLSQKDLDFSIGMEPCVDNENLMNAMFRLIHRVLESVNPVDVLKGVSPRWPHQVSDILPKNPDGLVAFFIHNFNFMEDPIAMLNAINSIVSLLGPPLHDSLIKYHATDHILLQATRLKVLDSLLKTLRAGKQPSIDDERKFYGLVSIFMSYVKMVCRQPLKAGLLMDEGETKALQLCSMFIYISENLANEVGCNEEDLKEMFDIIAGIGRDLYRAFRMGARGRPGPEIPLHPLIVEKDRNRKHVLSAPSGQPKTPTEYIALAMIAGRSTTRCCFNVACKSYFVHVGNDFKMCNQCLTAGYCSRACQAQDWRDKRYSHKRICPLLTNIVEIRGGWKGFYFEELYSRKDITTDGADMLMYDLKELVTQLRSTDQLDDSEFGYLSGWAERLYTKKVLGPVRMGETWHPGYDDYASMLEPFINGTLRGPKPQFMPKGA